MRGSIPAACSAVLDGTSVVYHTDAARRPGCTVVAARGRWERPEEVTAMHEHVVRIEAAHVADGIPLLDALRGAGFPAHLADDGGTWDIEVRGTIDEVVPFLQGWMDRRRSEPLVVVSDGCTYFLAPPTTPVAAQDALPLEPAAAASLPDRRRGPASTTS
jgi:hypothetical protein